MKEHGHAYPGEREQENARLAIQINTYWKRRGIDAGAHVSKEPVPLDWDTNIETVYVNGKRRQVRKRVDYETPKLVSAREIRSKLTGREG